GPGRCCSGVFGQAGKQSSVERCLEIEHFITDRDAAARSFPRRAEYAERKILDGKLGVAVRRTDPAAAPGIMCLVNEVRHRTASGLITLTGLPRAYARTREWYPEGRLPRESHILVGTRLLRHSITGDSIAGLDGIRVACDPAKQEQTRNGDQGAQQEKSRPAQPFGAPAGGGRAEN